MSEWVSERVGESGLQSSASTQPTYLDLLLVGFEGGAHSRTILVLVFVATAARAASTRHHPLHLHQQQQ